MTDFYAEVPPIEATWVGHRHYRGLSYQFSIRSTWLSGLDTIDAALSPLAVSPRPRPRPIFPDHGGAYAIVDTGGDGDDRFVAYLGKQRLVEFATERELIDHVLWHVNRSVIERSNDYFLVHAGAVVTPDGQAIALPGSSGSGKSTLVTALVTAGFGYLSDELGAIDPVTQRLCAYPRALTLKERSIPLFPDLWPGEDPGEHRTVHLSAECIRSGSIASPSRVGLVITPSYVRGARTEVRDMTRAETVAAVASHSLNLDTYGARSLPLLTEVLRVARGYRLVSGDLREAVAAVETLAASG